MLHLAGAQAAVVYKQLVYRGNKTYAGFPHADITVWYAPTGRIAHQIDVDDDTTTYGAWSPANITLWFRLQEPLKEAPAVDNHYILKWGNPTPAVLQNWAHIYPFQDRFTGSAINRSKWVEDGNPDLSFDGSAVTISGGSGNHQIASIPTFGTGYLSTMFGLLRPTNSVQHIAKFDEWNYASVPDNHWQNDGHRWRLDQYAGTSQNNVYADGHNDLHFHQFGLARDATGLLHGFLDGKEYTAPARFPDIDTFSVACDVYNGTDTNPMTMKVQWVKVRPWMSREPAATLE